MVAHAPKHQRRILGLSVCLGNDGVKRFSHGRGVAAVKGAHDLDARAVKALPDKLPCGLGAGVGVGAAADIAVLAALGNDLHKPAAVSERVKIDGGGGGDAKAAFKITLALQNLTGHALAAGHVAVGLQIPAAHDVPLAGLDQRTDLLKQGRIVLLHVFVNGCLVVAKDIVKIARQIDGRAEGGKHHARALLPIPLPDRVNVRVTDQMYLFHVSNSFRGAFLHYT